MAGVLLGAVLLASVIGVAILVRPSPGASPVATDATPATASGLIGSTTGAAPVYRAPDATWAEAVISPGLTIRRPADWSARENRDGRLDLYPPTSKIDSPSPLVSLTFLPGKKLADVAPPPATTPKQVLTIGGHPAWRVDDAARLPPYSRYVAVEVPGGVLFAQAYLGPGVDLGAFLDGVLSDLATMP